MGSQEVRAYATPIRKWVVASAAHGAHLRDLCLGVNLGLGVREYQCPGGPLFILFLSPGCTIRRNDLTACCQLHPPSFDSRKVL